MPNELNTNNRFIPESHFFTEVSAITQSAAQTFGPVSEDVFRLTAKFTATAGAKAFAICPGIVAIQPQTGSTDKVNLILRPYKQPIQGVNIRYFVYRGLTKSDFVDTNGKIIPTTAGVSDFIQKINEDFAAFHADEEVMPDFDATFIGYRETVDLNAPFDTLFFSVTEYVEVNGEQTEVPETAFELPKINQGKSLGTFAVGECGIDVILNYGDFILNEPDRFSFDFNYVRAAEATIDLTSVTDPVVRKRRKEQLFQFIDIAAFYGFHCTESGKVTTTSGASNTVHDTTTIYDLVLSPFASKNTYYLYIQSDRERSYDFYETYRIAAEEPENMLFGTTEANLTPRVYATNGWPIILETATQEHEELFNTVCLQLVTDNNVNTVLYGQTACVDNALRNHFSTIDQLQQPLDVEGNQPKLTTTIILSNPAVADGSVKKHIANFGILIYQGIVYSYIAGTEVNEANETVNVYAQPNFFDDVFGNLRAEGMMDRDTENLASNLSFGRLNLICRRNEGRLIGISVIQVLKIKDTITGTEESVDRVSFFAQQYDCFSPNQNLSSDIRTLSDKVYQATPTNHFVLNPPLRFNYSLIKDGNLGITGLEFLLINHVKPANLFLGFSSAEYEIITTTVLQSNLINSCISLKIVNSNENKSFWKYTPILIGENSEANLISINLPNIDFVYSIDNLVFFTKMFSNQIKPDFLLILRTNQTYNVTP